MPEKSSLVQQVQLGVETVQGTGVAAGTLLQSMSLTPGVKVEVDTFRPNGYKFPTLAIPNKEWSEVKVEGKPVYDELQYMLSSVMDVATITTPGGTTPRLWTFEPASIGADAPKTYTLEFGESGAGNASKLTGAIVTDFGLKFSRDEITMDATMLATQLAVGQTLTATPTAKPLFPITPGQLTMYMDVSGATLGTTKLTRAFSAEFTIGSRYSPVWPIDAANPSYAATIESEPEAEFTLMLAADTVGTGLLTPMRAGDTRFIRVAAQGPVIETTYYRSLKLDLAVKVTDVSEFQDEDGIYALEYTFAVVHDATWGRAMKVELQNSQATL
jgi:hypothetical protein